MSYELIAQRVHELVKNPKILVSGEQGLSSGGLKINESDIIERVFSKHEVSGGAFAIDVIPEIYWD